jgi:hypothetical protein
LLGFRLYKKISDEHNSKALLNDDLLRASSVPGSWQYKAVETLLKGKEIQLPEGASFSDKDGKSRHEIRVRWWGKGTTYRDGLHGTEVRAVEGEFSNVVLKGGQHTLKEKYDVFSKGNKEYELNLRSIEGDGYLLLSAKEKEKSNQVSSSPIGRGDGRYSRPR